LLTRLAKSAGVVDVENGIDNIIGGPATNFQVDPVPPAHMGFTSILDGVTTNAPVIADGRPSTVRIRLADNTRASLDAIQSTAFNRSTGYLAALREAMLLAAQRRLRPILMTAVAAIFGMLPLAFAFGAGSQILQPPVIAVIGGLLFSMLLSLTVTPIVYYLLTRNGPIHGSTQAVYSSTFSPRIIGDADIRHWASCSPRKTAFLAVTPHMNSRSRKIAEKPAIRTARIT